MECRIERLASRKDGEERLLDDVFGQALVTEHSCGDPQQRRAVAFDEGVEAAKFALLHALHQFAVLDAHATTFFGSAPIAIRPPPLLIDHREGTSAGGQDRPWLHTLWKRTAHFDAAIDAPIW